MVLVRPEDNHIATGSDIQEITVKVKTPKRVLQFCDGVLEEYSTDEEDNLKEEPAVDPGTLNWGPWLWYKASAASCMTLSAIDTVGGFFASVLGITTPRYYFELEEHRHREEERLKQEEEERGWSKPSAASACVPLNKEVSKEPEPVHV